MLKPRCPACGGSLERTTRNVEYIHRNRALMVDQPCLYCNACGEALLDPPDLAASQEALRPLMATLLEPEYTAALERIDQLMDVPPGTPESAELERLISAVEAYEDEHYSINSPTETQALCELIDQSERSARDGKLSLDEAFDEPAPDTAGESPFKNPKLISALDPRSGQAYWLAHVGQGVQDAMPMRKEHSLEFQRRIASGDLVASKEHYVYALQHRLTLYRSPNGPE